MRREMASTLYHKVFIQTFPETSFPQSCKYIPNEVDIYFLIFLFNFLYFLNIKQHQLFFH